MKFGVFGGSGLYEMQGISQIKSVKVETPFGEPSDEYVTGNLSDKEIIFLPRHGRGHRLLPSEINYRANIWGMKYLGVTHLISISAVGSLKEEIEPGHIVFPDQFIDRTRNRISTFFGDGLVAHLIFGNPVCDQLVEALSRAAAKEKIPHHTGGTYVCIEGPLFSTRAESNMYRSFDASVIGMTNMQEAKLAREAELCFATIALTTDYDAWHESISEVTIDMILEVMNRNIASAQAILKNLLMDFDPGEPVCPDQQALNGTLLTPPDRIPEATKKRLALFIRKYIE